ncbi:MAG: helix-turn-helix domain-containing protein [Mycobacteriales bacterium]
MGEQLRMWRERRRLSQLDLAIRAEISTRHLSFVETGRSRPSREMIVHLAEHLDLPLRERNHLLLAGGYAPVYTETPLDSPEMEPVRTAVRQLLTGHEPYPAIAVDRNWNLVDATASVNLLTAGVSTDLMGPPTNVLRVSLHPRGMAPRIANLGEWRAHLLDRLRRQVSLTADAELAELLAELESYPGGEGGHEALPDPGAIFVPLRLRTGDGDELAFFSTVSTFGTPLDITLAELVIEAFYPADPRTAAYLRDHQTVAAGG